MTDHIVEVPKKVLSPTAQAVLDAFLAEWADCFLEQDRRCLAAAIRALADQAINVKWSVEMWELHRDFHAIATELEAQ